MRVPPKPQQCAEHSRKFPRPLPNQRSRLPVSGYRSSVSTSFVRTCRGPGSRRRRWDDTIHGCGQIEASGHLPRPSHGGSGKIPARLTCGIARLSRVSQREPTSRHRLPKGTCSLGVSVSPSLIPTVFPAISLPLHLSPWPTARGLWLTQTAQMVVVFSSRKYCIIEVYTLLLDLVSLCTG